jgi:hypothetical protein
MAPQALSETITKMQRLMEVPQPDVNEGWGNAIVGATLFLTTILPMTVLSQKQSKNRHGDTIECAMTNKLLSTEEIKRAMKSMFSNGFKPAYRDSFSVADIDYLPEGNYMMVDAEGFDLANLNTVLDYTLDAYVLRYAKEMNKVKTYRLFKRESNKIEGIIIVYLIPYTDKNKPEQTRVLKTLHLGL